MPKLRARNATPQQCPLCREPLEGIGETLISCAGCETAYHRACAEEMGGCATLGCARREAETPRPAVRAPEGRDFLSRWDQPRTTEAPPRSVERPGLLSLIWDQFDGVHFSCALLFAGVIGTLAWARMGFRPGVGALLLLVGVAFAFAAAFLKDRLWMGFARGARMRGLRPGGAQLPPLRKRRREGEWWR